MLVGLLRLRRESGGSVSSGSLVWNQVGMGWSPFAVPLSIHSRVLVRKGTVWFLIAAAAEVPPTVIQRFCLANTHFAYYHVYAAGFDQFETERYYRFLLVC
jgi:hypothetical protein